MKTDLLCVGTLFKSESPVALSNKGQPNIKLG